MKTHELTRCGLIASAGVAAFGLSAAMLSSVGSAEALKPKTSKPDPQTPRIQLSVTGKTRIIKGENRAFFSTVTVSS